MRAAVADALPYFLKKRRGDFVDRVARLEVRCNLRVGQRRFKRATRFAELTISLPKLRTSSSMPPSTSEM